jgi:hypothetical protein
LRNYIVIALLLFACHAEAQRIPHYSIAATLNEKDNSLDGFLTVDYTNNTADSVRFLWFNIYPNAFKTDRTAFSEYMLSKRRTDFYFSNPGDRGYINRLDFRSGDHVLKTEDHPLYIDVIKVVFDEALPPGTSKAITTPFHVKLPYNFDGIGYNDNRYDLKYWYPAVAEYVKPLTSADSTSNLVANYDVKFSVRASNKISSPFISAEGFVRGSGDSLKTVTLTASSVNDVPVVIIRSPAKQPARATSSEHDIFKIMSRVSQKKPGSRKNADSSLTGKIKNILTYPLLPAVGYNEYDGFQLGILAQNFSKQNNLTYYVAPVYTFKSRNIAGIAGASYKILGHSGRSEEPGKFLNSLKKYVQEIDAGITASTFSYNDGVDVNNKKVFAKMFRIVPFVKLKFPSRLPDIDKTLTFKTFIIDERDLQYKRDSVGPIIYQDEGEYELRFVNELTFDYSSDRVLYPYHAQLQAQNGINWYRLNVAGNYFLNYPKGGGMNVRVFAAKFGYIGSLSSSDKFKNLRYMPKLTAVRGSEDYTYSNYFIGRNSFNGFGSRQIMMRDGGLKLRTDLFEGLQGRSDDWVASVNLNTTIPQIFPIHLPLKIFIDAGTFSEAWDDNYPNPRFSYVAGLQLSLFKDILNIYAPVFYSKVFRDQLKSVPEENKFLRKVSFSVDIQKLSFFFPK